VAEGVVAAAAVFSTADKEVPAQAAARQADSALRCSCGRLHLFLTFAPLREIFFFFLLRLLCLFAAIMRLSAIS
jgi:hypothetical protein